MRVVIIGAGIGGLATALSLEAAGFRDIQIYDRVARIRGLGVGINLLPHALRELTELGLAERIASLGVAPSRLGYHNRRGQLIWQEPRGLAAGYRWPQQSVHRGRLQLELLDVVRERLGDRVHASHRLVEVISGTDRDRVVFDTPDGPADVTADLVVAADGIHSAVRAQYYPMEGPPRESGLTLWRGTTVAAPFLDGTTMIMAGDSDQKFVAYPLSPPDADGLARINFVAEQRGAASAAVDWNAPVDPAPIVERFRDWSFDWLDIPGLLGAADEILEYPMVDRDALPRWTFGRTTLLGDAAHAMYPNGSNGASQAIIDARTLAHRLATCATVDEALESYEAERRPRTAALLEETRRTGPEQVMQLAYERAPEGFEHIDDVIPAAELAAIADGYKRAAGFHPEALNLRPSLSARVRA